MHNSIERPTHQAPCEPGAVAEVSRRVGYTGRLGSLLFLVAYTCSGLAGLVYEVSWTRLLTLYLGHTTAAASAVVAAFLGGLALGAAGGGAIAARLQPARALRAYAGLEILVALFALLLPFELRALTPVLRWAYA